MLLYSLAWYCAWRSKSILRKKKEKSTPKYSPTFNNKKTAARNPPTLTGPLPTKILRKQAKRQVEKAQAPKTRYCYPPHVRWYLVLCCGPWYSSVIQVRSTQPASTRYAVRRTEGWARLVNYCTYFGVVLYCCRSLLLLASSKHTPWSSLARSSSSYCCCRKKHEPCCLIYPAHTGCYTHSSGSSENIYHVKSSKQRHTHYE